MTSEDTLAAWRDYGDALARLDAAHERLRQTDRDGLVDLLRGELHSLGPGERPAFRFVNDSMTMMGPELVLALFPELIFRVAGPHWRGVRNKKLLLRIAPPTLKPLLAERVEEVLADPDSDWGDYWGLLDLLYWARFDDLMQPMIQAALTSQDEDIRGVGTDWTQTLDRSDVR